MMPVLHYTVTRNEIRPYMPAVPVVVSAAGYCFKGEKGYYLRPPPLPEHVVTRGADCGGFVATTRWGGCYRFKPRYYANWLMKWRPQWVAVIDLCCLDLDERGMPCYPGKEEVKRRQKFCTAMAHHFWAVFQHLPLTWVVTIQGWHPEEYVRHA